MRRDLKLEWLDPKTLEPNPRNWRQHPEQQKKLLDAVLAENGWAGVALWNETTGHLIDGHARREWAIEHNEMMPVVIGRWTEEQEKKILATLDPIAAMAEQADDIYRELLEGIETDNEDLQAFCDDMLQSIMGATETGGYTDPDEAPPLPEKAVSRAGDLSILGKHRLLCGSSIVPSDVEHLLGGVTPLLMVTDPPYGVEYDPSWRGKALHETGHKPGNLATGKVQNDDRADWREAWALFPGNVAYVWHAGNKAHIVAESLSAVNFQVRAQIVWVKQRPVISRGHYHHQHEPCWYGVKDGADDNWRFIPEHMLIDYAVRKGKTADWQGSRKQSSVWFIEHIKSDTGHGTQKPVECMKRPIMNNSSPGQAVYEPFSGSGTTIIAAEQTARCCYAIEIDPLYVDVGIERWQNFTAKKAILDGDGRSFEEVAAARTAE